MTHDRRSPGIGFVLAALAVGQLLLATSTRAQQSTPAPLTRAQLDELRTTLDRHMDREESRLRSLQRQVDVAMLHYRLSDIAHVDQVRFFGPPEDDGDEPRPISAFVFIPKDTDHPEHGTLVIWQRGEDELEIESWSDVPELRELVGRGVTVIAPSYEGAPEERLDAVTDYALQRYPFLDPSAVRWREPR